MYCFVRPVGIDDISKLPPFSAFDIVTRMNGGQVEISYDKVLRKPGDVWTQPFIQLLVSLEKKAFIPICPKVTNLAHFFIKNE